MRLNFFVLLLFLLLLVPAVPADTVNFLFDCLYDAIEYFRSVIVVVACFCSCNSM